MLIRGVKNSQIKPPTNTFILENEKDLHAYYVNQLKKESYPDAVTEIHRMPDSDKSQAFYALRERIHKSAKQQQTVVNISMGIVSNNKSLLRVMNKLIDYDCFPELERKNRILKGIGFEKMIPSKSLIQAVTKYKENPELCFTNIDKELLRNYLFQNKSLLIEDYYRTQACIDQIIYDDFELAKSLLCLPGTNQLHPNIILNVGVGNERSEFSYYSLLPGARTVGYNSKFDYTNRFINASAWPYYVTNKLHKNDETIKDALLNHKISTVETSKNLYHKEIRRVKEVNSDYIESVLGEQYGDNNEVYYLTVSPEHQLNLTLEWVDYIATVSDNQIKGIYKYFQGTSFSTPRIHNQVLDSPLSLSLYMQNNGR